MNLPDDICRCFDAECPRKDRCARWTERGAPGEAVVKQMTCLNPGERYAGCTSFIEADVEPPA